MCVELEEYSCCEHAVWCMQHFVALVTHQSCGGNRKFQTNTCSYDKLHVGAR